MVLRGGIEPLTLRFTVRSISYEIAIPLDQLAQPQWG
jgi:hypothetical protein